MEAGAAPTGSDESDGVAELRRAATRTHWLSFWPMFGLWLLLPTALLLWAVSYPGTAVFLVLLSLLVLGLSALAWLAAFLASWRRDGWTWWYAVAPVGGLVVAVLVVSHAPLDTRFALSRDAFDRDVRELLAEANSQDGLDRARVDTVRIGSYTITAREGVPGGVLYHEAGGGFFEDAGFAYLPAGPTAALENGGFESPQWHHIDGPWWSWVASW